MRHWLLKFNYAVEIGANLAYLGHFQATGDNEIRKIAIEELEHREKIKEILLFYKQKPFFLFNWFFYIVGHTIKALCQVSPKFMLNFVAKTMETFAIFNYRKLANLYPYHKHTLLSLAIAEERHERYFSKSLPDLPSQNTINR